MTLLNKKTLSAPAFEIRRADQRGKADLGWLKSWHTFSFASYHDENQLGFSDLLVINDDRIQGGGGFGTHPHRNMEIFTYVLEGALQHRDSMGNGSVIRPGDVQMMSAGTGVQHSEFNASPKDEAHLLQIWIVPNENGLSPTYQQANFADDEKRGRLRLVISPNAEGGSLTIRQDAKVYAGLLDGAESFRHQVDEGRRAYVHVARGKVELNGQALSAGDGVRVRAPGELRFAKGERAEVLVFDLADKELPDVYR